MVPEHGDRTSPCNIMFLHHILFIQQTMSNFSATVINPLLYLSTFLQCMSIAFVKKCLNVEVKDNFVCSHQVGTVAILTGKLNSGANETAQAVFLAHLALIQAPGCDIMQVTFLDWQHYLVVVPMIFSLHH